MIHNKVDIIDPKKSVYDFKLGDFGQTRSLDNVHQRPTWNTNCVPPEVIWPEKFGTVDHRADVYQAGLLLLSFYTKDQLPLDSQDVHEGKPRKHAEAVGTPLGEAIAKMLRRHVEHRTPTALDAWREIDAALKLQ